MYHGVAGDRMVMDYTLKCYVPAAGGTSSEIRPLS